MEKRFIIAIALSVAVVLLFQSQMKKAIPPPVYAPTGQQAVPIQAASPQDAPDVIDKSLQEKESLAAIQTDKFIITVTNIGGSVKDIKLKEFKDQGAVKPLVLVRDLPAQDAIFSIKLQNPPAFLNQVVFDLKRENDKLVYSYKLQDRYEIKKEYVFSNTNDYIELRIFIKNITDYPQGLQYVLSGPSRLESTDKLMGRNFLESDSMVDGKLIRKSGAKKGEEFFSGNVAWTAMKNRYFSIVMKPAKPAEGVFLRQAPDKNLYSSIRTRVEVIQPGSALMDSYVLYIGPTDTGRIAALNMGLEGIVNYGLFTGITVILMKILRFLEGIVHNWGLAIIILTLLVNIILFPLTKKSFMSMRKMQEVQPHIEKLRKLHKDSPHKLNKEMAELYKTHNINPFGGCLPLFMQFPVFISLYQALIKSIELKNSGFLWIKDLSGPDAVPLPFSLPFIGNHINVLPILWAGAMLVQQKLSGQGMATMGEDQKKQQQIMMFMFPLIFVVLLYNMPSGFVLYMLTSTSIMALEQASLRKKT